MNGSPPKAKAGLRILDDYPGSQIKQQEEGKHKLVVYPFLWPKFCTYKIKLTNTDTDMSQLTAE